MLTREEALDYLKTYTEKCGTYGKGYISHPLLPIEALTYNPSSNMTCDAQTGIPCEALITDSKFDTRWVVKTCIAHRRLLIITPYANNIENTRKFFNAIFGVNSCTITVIPLSTFASDGNALENPDQVLDTVKTLASDFNYMDTVMYFGDRRSEMPSIIERIKSSLNPHVHVEHIYSPDTLVAYLLNQLKVNDDISDDVPEHKEAIRMIYNDAEMADKIINSVYNPSYNLRDNITDIFNGYDLTDYVIPYGREYSTSGVYKLIESEVFDKYFMTGLVLRVFQKEASDLSEEIIEILASAI